MAQYKRSDFELMAPAGSRESLAAAIAGGADSVYFGVGRLNMRAHTAGNLMAEEVPEIMGIVHGAGKKGISPSTPLFTMKKSGRWKAWSTSRHCGR